MTSDQESRLLAFFLKDRSAFISGETIASELNLSRVAVWNKLKSLEQQGFQFEAIRKTGSRLLKTPATLHPGLIRSLLFLKKDCDLRALYYRDAVDSTNSEAERLLDKSATAPFAVLSAQQEKGRGRQGKHWVSEPNGNLYLSLAIRPDFEPSIVAPLSLWAGIRVAESLSEKFSSLTPQLKWPNDLWINQKKVGGILIEARIDSQSIRDLVIGLGLNLRDKPNFPNEKAAGVEPTSLGAELNADFDCNDLVVAIIDALLGAYRQVTINGRGDLPSRWARFDALKGKKISFTKAGEHRTGVATGVSPDGSLIVNLGDSSERLHSGEVSLIRRE